jgi:hypothetical protein
MSWADLDRHADESIQARWRVVLVIASDGRRITGLGGTGFELRRAIFAVSRIRLDRGFVVSLTEGDAEQTGRWW